MRSTKIYLDGHSEDCCSAQVYLNQNNNSKREEGANRKHRAMLSLVGFVMQHELSDNQRECLYLVKIKGLSIKEVANMRGVASSTVCRHLQAAQKIVDKAFEHFCCINKFVDWSDTE